MEVNSLLKDGSTVITAKFEIKLHAVLHAQSDFHP